MLRYNIFILFAILQSSFARLEEEIVDPCTTTNLGCYHRPQEACPPPGSVCRCKVDTCSKALICCDVDAFRLTEGLGCANTNVRDDITSVHIRNATIDTLNVSELIKLRRSRSMAITDGRIGSIVGEFPKLMSISCLNLSSNGITNFEDRSLVNLFNLSTLDLSHNNLSDVPRFKKEGLVKLDISGNKPMQCASIFEALKRPELQFNNGNITGCLQSHSFSWFNSTEELPLEQVEKIHELKKNCNKYLNVTCTCELHRLDFIDGTAPTITVKVTCTNQQLTDLPTPLPPNTTALNVTNNNITSLERVSDDPSYESLRELYADNNEITSILPLEGTKFIAKFQILGLKNNKLKTIPTYVLSNIFDRNYNSRQVTLGHNKLLCDCNTAKIFKVWLLTKQKHIPDFEEIFCENVNVKVIELDPSTLCQSQHDWTDYIYYIITAEVLLLIGLIAKVSYDYWVFKTAGYLPWPASKMPKLPCDWLCE